MDITSTTYCIFNSIEVVHHFLSHNDRTKLNLFFKVKILSLYSPACPCHEAKVPPSNHLKIHLF